MARSYEDYAKHIRFYGPEGVLEAAERDLDEKQLEDLTKLAKQHKRPPALPKRKRGRRK